ncbi:anaphase-promoting complex, subunit 10/DOC domain-containing protein [Globomyces pollinis-pini]|nr:anaphase-promoting complex, subunit 10/DOC domain-containing protein [Globomyces pollinis-pini]
MKRNVTSIANVSLSSSKPGYGVANLIDPDLERYWQSDGPQPHYINFEFNKRIKLSTISIYVNAKQDESYCPKVIQIKAGTSLENLQHVKKVDLSDLSGWVEIEMNEENLFINAFLVQFIILNNHLNGKDTHVRGIELYSFSDPMEEMEI